MDILVALLSRSRAVESRCSQYRKAWRNTEFSHESYPSRSDRCNGFCIKRRGAMDLPQGRVTLDKNPVGFLSWNMTRMAIRCPVLRHVDVKSIRLEQGPTPASTPIRIIGETSFPVFHHHEILHGLSRPSRCPSGYPSRAELADLFDEHGAIGEMPGLAVSQRYGRRSVKPFPGALSSLTTFEPRWTQ